MDKEVFKDINYGMYIVSAKDENKVGCVINTLTQITSENPTISISVNKDNYTNQIINNTKKFIVSILSEKIDPNIISKFGFQSSRNVDKFKDIDYEIVDDIPVLLKDVCGYMVCDVIEEVDVGTHTLFIAKVSKAKKVSNLAPMTYKYYHEVIKGKAPKTAPTYIEEVKTNTWVCDICGYVHEGPVPDDFICPICGVDASHFKQKK